MNKKVSLTKASLARNAVKLASVAAVSLFPLAASASAKDQGALYMDLGLGYSYADTGSNPTSGSGMTAGRKGITSALGIGYNFTNHVAMEIGYRELGKMTVRNPGIGEKETMNTNAFYIGPVFTYPVMQKLDVTARFGLDRWRSDVQYINLANTRQTKRNSYYGIGASYRIDDDTKVGIDYTRFRVNQDAGSSFVPVHAIDALDAHIVFMFR